MPHTTTKRARTKRPDFRPNGKRRLQAQQRKQEKDRLARVAANELKGKLFAPLRHEPLPKISNNTATTTNSNMNRAQILRKAKPNNKDSSNIRFRALHKLLRQIVALEEKQTAGSKLDEAQLAKLGRFDEVVEELEEMQRALDEDDDDEEEDDEDEEEDDDMDEEEEAEDEEKEE
ncbi:hypothetical protein ACHAXR_007137 [Thalassiosira sp. AJA248-18]